MPSLTAIGGAGLLLFSVACGSYESDDDMWDLGSDSLLSENGLSENGLSPNGISANGLSGNGLSGNGLSSNGLSLNGLSVNGLGKSAFKGWFDSGRNNASSHAYAAQLMKYVVRCACPAGKTRTFTDPATNNSYSWEGNLGLAPNWCNGSAATTADQEWVSGCLIAHLNVLADEGKAPSSMQLSVRINASSPSMLYSGEELGMLDQSEGYYFGNLFDQQAGGKKGLYVGRTSTILHLLFRWDFGRRLVLEGSDTANVQLAGWKSLSATPPTPDYWFIPSYGHSLVSCSRDSDCSGVNEGQTPSCSADPSAGKYCIPRVNACSVDSNDQVTSCRDPSGRTWSRVVEIKTSRAITDKDDVFGGGAELLTGLYGHGHTHNTLVTGLGNGGWVELKDIESNQGPTSNYYRVSIRYQNSGSLKVETRPNDSATRTSCGTKSLSCPSGQFCWAIFQNCKMTNGRINWVRVTGTSQSAPDLDNIVIGAER